MEPPEVPVVWLDRLGDIVAFGFLGGIVVVIGLIVFFAASFGKPTRS